MNKLSIFIITKDEAERLPATLKACEDLSDDIIVVDSGSTDDTVEIAKSFGARVVHRDWEGYGQQKVYGQSLCKHDFVLNLDADETPLDDVKSSIMEVLALSPDKRAPAYSLRICYVSRFAGSLTPRPFAPVNVTPRLYDRRKAGFKDSAVHDKVVVYDGSKPPVLKGAVAHRCVRSFSHMWEKIQNYSQMQAMDKYKRGKKPSGFMLLIDPPMFFFKYLILRRLIFVGWEGVVVASAHSAGRALRIGMTMELFKNS